MNTFDPSRTLILLFTQGEWSDKTDSILSMGPSSHDGFLVRFKNKPEKAFPYALTSVIIANNPEVVDCSELFHGQKRYFGFQKVLYFKEARTYKLFYPNNTMAFSSDECRIVHKLNPGDIPGGSVIAYYQEIAKKIGALQEDEDYRDFLEKQYSKIPEDYYQSALGEFLKGGSPDAVEDHAPFIFPFSFNASQNEAIKNAFLSRSSIIMGPPGTGKTQTILNIAANAIVRGQSLAICSNNNAALENARDKLIEEGYGGIVATLGKFDNVKEFFAVPHPDELELPETPEDAAVLTFEQATAAKLSLGKLKDKEALDQSQLAAIKEEFGSFCKRNVIPTQRFDQEKPYAELWRDGDPETCLLALAELEKKAPESLGFFRRIFYHFSLHLPLSLLRQPLEEIALFLPYRYYQRKIELLENDALAQHKEILRITPLVDETRIRRFSRSYFNQALLSHRTGLKASSFTVDNFRDSFKSFVACFPVVLSSTYSLLQTAPLNYQFDLLVIDEGSQVSMASAILALSKARRVVVVGDLNQLSAISDPGIVSDEEAVFAKNPIPECYRYRNNNLLLAYREVFKDRIPTVLLNEHYRCQNDIIAFSNRRLYGNQLICLTPPDHLESHLKLIHTVPGDHARKNPNGSGLYNEREISEVLAEVKAHDPKYTLAVITPYRNQADRLAKLLPPEIPVDTIHKFQGRECDDVIFSTVANNAEDFIRGEGKCHSFVNNCELLNVAMTRAKHHFTLITSDRIYRHSPWYLGDLVRYMKKNAHCEIETGKIHSVFDLLYSDYSQTQSHLTSTSRKKKDEEIAEKLLADLLKDLLQKKDYESLKVVEHVNLKSVIALDPKSCTSEELRYLTHPWTHVDFTIYNVFDQKPVLFIEVDGVAFHEQKSKQAQHDAIKNKAIEASGIPFLRLKTNGDSEKEQITALLDRMV
jgi:Protein of unknown function (DUF2726).